MTIKLLAALPHGGVSRSLGTLSAKEVLQSNMDVTGKGSYYVSERSGYVHLGEKALNELKLFTEMIAKQAKEYKYNYLDALRDGAFMLWKHTNDKAVNQELSFQYKQFPVIERHLPVAYL